MQGFEIFYPDLVFDVTDGVPLRVVERGGPEEEPQEEGHHGDGLQGLEAQPPPQGRHRLSREGGATQGCTGLPGNGVSHFKV